MFLDDPETGDKKWTGVIKDSSLRSHWRKIDLGTGVLCGMLLMFESHPFLNETMENVFDIIRPQNCFDIVMDVLMHCYPDIKSIRRCFSLIKEARLNCEWCLWFRYSVNFVQFRFRRFRSGTFDVKDTTLTGRPVVENIDNITEIIEVDWHVSSRSIAQELKIDHKTVLSHLRKVGFKRQLHV
ncbi:histone-lysine N-methyltransferase SETMAR [Trichonephila clavipes]|nr:histone-lysine N-methyltransferase SETMAR [Trichonephila clavipes]